MERRQITKDDAEKGNGIDAAVIYFPIAAGSDHILHLLSGMSRKKVLFYNVWRIMPPDSLTSVC